MDPNWIRWIFASMSKFFDSKKGQLNLYIEGTDKTGRRKDQEYAEFRMNGPLATEISSHYWRLTFDINVIVYSTKDSDSHKIFKDIGQVTQMFCGAIPIYKYGTQQGDDGTLLDCALLQMFEGDSGIRVNQYGQYDPSLLMLASTVEATYQLTLDT